MLAHHVSSETQFPLIDVVGDTSKFVGAILSEPDKYEGKTFCAAMALYSLDEIVGIMSRGTGKTVVYRQISREDFKKRLLFSDRLVDNLVENLSYQEEFGYFGPHAEKRVAWAAENARGGRGGLSTFLSILGGTSSSAHLIKERS